MKEALITGKDRSSLAEFLIEKDYDVKTGKMRVYVNPVWFRPIDVDNLWGDSTKSKTVWGWNPHKTTYEELIEIMTKYDRMLTKQQKSMKEVL